MDAYTPSLDRVDALMSQQTPDAEQTTVAYTPTLDRVDALMTSNVPQEMPATQAVNPNDSRGFFNNVARHAGAVVASYGRDLINTPNSIYSGFPKLSPLVGIPDNYDYYQALGVDRGFADDAAKNVLDFAAPLFGVGRAAKVAATGFGKLAPYLPKTAEMLQKGVGSSLFQVPTASAVQGAVNTPDDRTTGALEGLGWGLTGWAGGKATDAVLRKGFERYAQSAIPTLISNATDKIKNYITPEQAAANLQKTYNKAAGVNAANWQQTNALADALDSHLTTQGKAFDATPFTKTLQDFTGKTSQMEPALRAKYDQALGFANHIQDQAPQSFAGAVALRQNLNQELSKYLDKNNILAKDTQTKGLIKQLKSGLQDTVNANQGNVDSNLFNQFSNTWNAANKSHMALQDFYKAPNPTGTLKANRPLREALQSGELDSAALGKFVRPVLNGTSGTSQLNKLTGNDDAARSYLMRDVLEGRAKPDAALNAYEKLSPPQRQALFGNQSEGAALNAANYAKSNLGALPEKGFFNSPLGHHVGMFGVPGAVTAMGSLAMGDNWKDAAEKGATVGLGVAAGGAIPRILGKYVANPALVNKAVNFATSQNKNAGRYLSPVLASLFAREGQS